MAAATKPEIEIARERVEKEFGPRTHVHKARGLCIVFEHLHTLEPQAIYFLGIGLTWDDAISQARRLVLLPKPTREQREVAT